MQWANVACALQGGGARRPGSRVGGVRRRGLSGARRRGPSWCACSQGEGRGEAPSKLPGFAGSRCLRFVRAPGLVRGAVLPGEGTFLGKGPTRLWGALRVRSRDRARVKVVRSGGGPRANESRVSLLSARAPWGAGQPSCHPCICLGAARRSSVWRPG